MTHYDEQRELSFQLREECCGTTCNKIDLAKRVAELEHELYAVRAELDDVYRLRKNKEEFARRCFQAGYRSALPVVKEHADVKAWLNFKVVELGNV